MKDLIIVSAAPSDAYEIANLHQDYIKAGFLSTLGQSVLALLYSSIINSDSAICIVAKRNTRVVGFVSGTRSVGGIYKEFIKDYFFKASLLLIPKCFNPSFLRKVLESLFYPFKVEKGLPDAELLSIVVAEDVRGKGVSQMLFNALVAEFRERGVEEFKIAVGNDLTAAHKFYRKMGCVQNPEPLEVHKGEMSKIYIYEC